MLRIGGMDFIKNALKLLELKSTSEDGNEEVVNFLIPLFEQMGAKLILQQIPHSLPDHNKRQYNLVAIFGDDLVDSRTRKGLLLTNHIDTADPGAPEDWTELLGKPWSPLEKDGFLYGPGAADAKLDFLCKVAACETFKESKFREPVYLAATCGADSLLQGSRYLIQSGAVNPRHVIVGSPTGLRVANRQKHHLVFRVRISFVSIERDSQEFNAKIFISSRTRGVHVAHPEAQKSALANVMLFLDQIRNSPVPNRLFSFQGGSSLRKMPDTATAGIVITSRDLDTIRDRFRSISANHRDCNFEMRFGGTGDRGLRLLPDEVYPVVFKLRDEVQRINDDLRALRDDTFAIPESQVILSAVRQERDYMDLILHYHVAPEFASEAQRKELEADLKRRIAAISSECHTISLDCRRILSVPHLITSADSTFSQTLRADLQRVGISTEFRSSSTTSEAGYFAEKGYETVLFGPGENEGNAYCPNERVKVDDLMSAVSFYTRTIEAFCVRGI